METEAVQSHDRRAFLTARIRELLLERDRHEARYQALLAERVTTQEEARRHNQEINRVLAERDRANCDAVQLTSELRRLG